MAMVRDILKYKGTQIWTIEAGDTIGKALKLMAEKNIGAVPVLEGGKIVGIFSERDFARFGALADQLCTDKAIRELMVSPVYFVSPDQTTDDCMAVMTAKHLRHLPVIENARLIGMVSIGDIVKQIIADKQHTIEDLEHFLWVNMV